MSQDLSQDLPISSASTPSPLNPASVPRVSLCLTVRHQPDYAKQAIASILKQTFADFELILCEAEPESESAISAAAPGGEEENEPIRSEIFNYLETLQDDRIRYLGDRWASRAAQLRAGFALAEGEYFVQLDEQHRLTPDYLARTVALLDQYPEIDFVSTGHWLIDGAGRRDLCATEQNAEQWGRTRLQDGPLDNLLEETFVHQSLQTNATLFRREALAEVGFLRLGLDNCEDSDLLVRLALAGKRAYFLSARLMEYRMPKPQRDLVRVLEYFLDKVAYLDFFRFPSSSLELLRQHRLADSYLSLGLRLIEAGDLSAGRQSLWRGRRAHLGKACAGLLLSYLSAGFRQQAFGWLRRLASSSSTELQAGQVAWVKFSV